MHRYCLNPGVYFITGAKRGSVCDTTTGNVYSINEVAKKTIQGEIQNDEFWQKLVSMGLAKESADVTHTQNLPDPIAINLDFIWFEIISDDCNERCVHCYADSMPPTYRKMMNLVPLQVLPLNSNSRNHYKLTAKDWIRLIQEGYELGCKQCQFIGGEPFLYKGEMNENVLDLAEYAKAIGYEFVEIFTNATVLNEEKVARIKDLELNIAVSLYSDQADIHDAITRSLGSHKKTIEALHLLKEAGINTRVEMVVMRNNETTVLSTQKLIDQMGFGHKHPDPLRPKGRGDNPDLSPSKEAQVKYGLMTQPNFRADPHTIAHYSSAHSCLAGKITITDKGDILPCIFSRNHVLGNVVIARSIKNIIESEALQTVWRTTKDDVLVCKDCEYRYVCFDCRPLSEGAALGRSDYLHAPYPRCTYNPYTGEWKAGIWKVDENGQPHYNRSWKEAIQQVLESESDNGGILNNSPVSH